MATEERIRDVQDEIDVNSAKMTAVLVILSVFFVLFIIMSILIWMRINSLQQGIVSRVVEGGRSALASESAQTLSRQLLNVLTKQVGKK